VIPHEAPFGLDDVNFLLLARNGITQRSKLQFGLAWNTQFGSHAVYAQLDRLTNWPFEFLDRSGQRLPGHAAQLARKNGGKRIGLLLAGLIVDEEDDMPMPLVNRVRIFKCDHGANAVQRNISEAAGFYFVTQYGLTFAFIGITAKLTITAMLAIAGFDAHGFDAERRLGSVRPRRRLFRFCFCRHLRPPTRESR